MGRLEDQTAVITGGASGIGEAAVRLFTQEGARVVIADVQDAKGETLADSLAGAAVYQHTDVTQEHDVRAAIQRAQDEYGRIDCVFNNAGIAGAGGPIADVSMEDYDRLMAVLIRGVFLGIKYAAAAMKPQGSGTIINTASIAGLRAGYAGHVYSAAKAAVVQLTTTASMELGEDGIRVNCICPGGIATPIFKPLFDDADDAAVVETMKQGLAQMQPIKRSGLPEDIANAALWLASDESSFVNGLALVVDGGVTGGRSWQDTAQLRGRI